MEVTILYLNINGVELTEVIGQKCWLYRPTDVSPYWEIHIGSKRIVATGQVLVIFKQ